MAVRSDHEPGLIGTMEAVLGTIEELGWMAPGSIFFCGCASADPRQAVFADFAEYDSVEFDHFFAA